MTAPARPKLRVVPPAGDTPAAPAARPKRRAKSGAEAKRRALWGRVGKLASVTGMGRDDAELVMRDHVQQLTGGDRSTKSLSGAQHGELLARLDAMISERPTTRAGRAEDEDSDALITRDQSAALVQLGLAVGLDRTRLRSWIVGKMGAVCDGRTWPQTRGQAIKLHEGLEAWLIRQPRSQPNQVLKRAKTCKGFGDLTDWEQTFLDDLVGRKGFPTKDRQRVGTFFRGHWKQLVKLAEVERKRGQAVDLPEDDGETP